MRLIFIIEKVVIYLVGRLCVVTVLDAILHLESGKDPLCLAEI
jgi:hypothetical protein